MVEPAADSGSFALIFGKLDVGGKIEEAASPILVKLAVFRKIGRIEEEVSSNFPENGAFRQNSGSSFVYFIHPNISATPSGSKQITYCPTIV
jgi:hypothetical protein